MEYGLHVKESLNHVQNGVSFYNAIFWTSFYVPVWESPAPGLSWDCVPAKDYVT